jgi:hypothetical protein
MSFDKRTGLSEHIYAMSSTQSRSAADVHAKEEKSAIRPEKMAKDVASMISEVSQIEKFLAVIEVQGEDLVNLLGPMGASLWARLISQDDIIEVAREMRATVEASDVRKPNKARDAENMQMASGFIAPMLQTYASLTGDSNPLNAFMHSFGEAVEMSTGEWTMGPWIPETPEEVQQQQQQMVELEMGEKQSEIEKTQAETQKILSEIGQGGGELESQLPRSKWSWSSQQFRQSRTLLVVKPRQFPSWSRRMLCISRNSVRRNWSLWRRCEWRSSRTACEWTSSDRNPLFGSREKKA